MERPFLTEIALPVRTYDIDYAGIVSNIVYIRWLEDLRLQMLSEQFPLEEQLEQGIAPVLLATEIAYKRAIRILDRPLGRMWLRQLGRLRWTLEAEIVVADRSVATAVQRGVFIQLSTMRPVAVPPAVSERYVRASGGGTQLD